MCRYKIFRPIILFLFVFMMIGCNGQTSNSPAVPETAAAVLPTSSPTLAPPTSTFTPIPPTATSTNVPPTPTNTPEPLIFPVAGKWAGKGENGLTVLFSIVTDQKSFAVVRGFQTPKINWTCSGYRIGFWLSTQPDFMINDGTFGYTWMIANVIAPDKIEGSFNTRFDICGEVIMKWTASPQNPASGRVSNDLGGIQ